MDYLLPIVEFRGTFKMSDSLYISPTPVSALFIVKLVNNFAIFTGMPDHILTTELRGGGVKMPTNPETPCSMSHA